LRDYYIKSFIK